MAKPEKKTTTVELDDGREITIEHPADWSERRIKSYAVVNAPPVYKDALSDPTDSISTLDLIQAGVMDDLMAGVPDIFLSDSPVYEGGDLKPFDPSAFEDADEMLRKREQFVRETVGIPLDVELETGQNILRALSSPSTWIGVGKTGASTTLGKVAGTLGQATEAGVSTAAAVGAAEATYDYTKNPILAELAAIGGGTGTGIASSVARAPLSVPLRAADKAYGAAQSADVSETKENVIKRTNAVSEFLAEKSIQAQLNSIRETPTGRPEAIAQAVDTIEEIKTFVPDLKMEGIAGVLADNPAVQEWMRKVAQHNPSYVDTVKQNVSDNLGVLQEKLGEITGMTGRVDETDVYTAAKKIYDSRIETLDAQEINSRKQFEKNMAKLINRVSAKSPDEVGRLANEASVKREQQLREKVSSLYDASKAFAKNKELPSNYVADLSNLAKSIKNTDPFGPDSATAAKLRSRWSPETELREIDGMEVDVETTPVVPLQELSSLKKAISADLTTQYRQKYSNPLAPTRIEALQTLQTKVKKIIDELELDPKTRGYARSLKKADKFYYENLGLPMSAAGMRLIKNADLNKSIASHLANDTQKARDYINFVGKREGKAVLKHAIRMKAEGAILNPDGTVSTQKLENFKNNKTNQELIALAGMEKEFDTTSSRLETIVGTRERQKKAYDVAVQEMGSGFFKTILNKNLPGAVREMINNPSKRKDILAEVNKLSGRNKDLIMASIRKAYINEGMKTTKPLATYLRDNKAATVDIFGNDYVQDLAKFGAIYDIVVKLDGALSKVIGVDPVMDIMQQKVGISLAEGIGLARNQILSTQRKFINAGSKIYLEKGKRRYYKKSAEVLEDPEVLKQLANPPEEAWKNTKEALKMAKMGKNLTVETWNDTVMPYFLAVLTESGIFGAVRGINPAENKERERLLMEQETQQ